MRPGVEMDAVKETVKGAVRGLLKNEKTMRSIYAVTVAFLMLITMYFYKESTLSRNYVEDGKGNVVAIKVGDKSGGTYDMSLRVERGNDVTDRDVSLSANGDAQAKGRGGSGNKKRISDAEREAEIRQMIYDIERPGKVRRELPKTLSDGSRLTWKRSVSTGKDTAIALGLYAFIVALIIKSDADEKKKEHVKARNSILKSLPRFTNQLLLMMNAGMILNDAFERIAMSYSVIPKEEMGVFESEIVDISRKTRETNGSAADVLTEFAAKYKVKELMRIAVILTENEKRGSDVTENLDRESRYLWENRKITAEERGKMIDTKMAYPLGLLLILLIVITMAPAMLNMR